MEKRTYYIFNKHERVAIVYAHDAQYGADGDLYLYEWEDGDKDRANLIARIPAWAYTNYDNINRNPC